MYHSFRPGLLNEDSIFDDRVKPVPEVKDFNEHSVVLNNGDVLEIESVVLCTGYEYSFPFLSENCQPMTADDTDFQHLSRLYKMTVHVDEPNLYFMGMMKCTPAFLLNELQAQFIAAILSRKSKLPTKSDMLADIEADFQLKLGIGYPRTKIPFILPAKYFIKRFQDSLLEITEDGWIRPIPDTKLEHWDSCIRVILANPNQFRSRQYPLDVNRDGIPRAKPLFGL